MKPGTMTAAQVHKQYSEAVTAFRRWIPDPTLRQAFNREADSFFQHCALGVWQADNAQAITPKHVEFYNAIYSGKNLSPSALYWEVASGVANYDLFQPPALTCFSPPPFSRPCGTTTGGRAPLWPGALPTRRPSSSCCSRRWTTWSARPRPALSTPAPTFCWSCAERTACPETAPP